MAQWLRIHLSIEEMLETQVQSLGQEDPLGKEMATNSRILAWRIPWTEEPGGLLSMGSQRVGHDWVTNTVTFSLLLCDVHNQAPRILWLSGFTYLGRWCYQDTCFKKKVIS